MNAPQSEGENVTAVRSARAEAKARRRAAGAGGFSYALVVKALSLRSAPLPERLAAATYGVTELQQADVARDRAPAPLHDGLSASAGEPGEETFASVHKDVAAEALGEIIRFDGSPRAIEIEGLGAAEASAKIHGRNSVRQLLLTFVAYDGLVYRIAGTVPMAELPEVRPHFTRTAFSFHVLTEAERKEIFENRLEIVRANGSEDLAQLGEKYENQWSLAETALANGVEEDASLAVGWWVKVARQRPYSGPRSAERSPPQAQDP